MKLTRFLLAAVLLALTGTAPAQDTNALKTTLGVFEAQTGIILIRGSGFIGSFAAGPAEISVMIKETTDVDTGGKAYGLALEITGNQMLREKILIDDDEVAALLNGLNYLAKVNADVTSLPAFDASYTTRAGLRIIADSIRREGGVQFFVKYDVQPRLPLSAVQMTQFTDLIVLARKNLDALKSAK